MLTLGKEQNNVECVISYDSTDKEYHAMVYQVINGTLTQVSDRVVGRDPIQVQVYFDDDDTHAERIRQPVTLCFIFKWAASGV